MRCSGISHVGPSTTARFGFRISRQGFTLIELMVVVSIMGIVMAMSAPAIYRLWHGESLRKAASEVQEVCSHARARAILRRRDD